MGVVRKYHHGRWFHFENALMSGMTRAGVIPHTYLLTTTGRRTGQRRSNPVTIVKVNGKRWLVAPYGAVPWVLNARASGEVTISRRRATRQFRIREADVTDAAPVLKQYVSVAYSARPYFHADPGDSVAEFAAEAEAHPVFELLPKG